VSSEAATCGVGWFGERGFASFLLKDYIGAIADLSVAIADHREQRA
jgi:hypothetical protein